MSLSSSTYKPRVAYGAGYESFVDLPTGALEWQETFSYELEQSVPPGGTGSVVTGYRRGPTLIRIKAEVQTDDPDAVETQLRAIENAIASGTFMLFSHYDTSSETYRYYKSCYGVKFIGDIRTGDPYRPGRNSSYELQVVATDPTIYGTAPSEDLNDFTGDVSFYPGVNGMLRVFNPDNELVFQMEPLTGDLKIAGRLFEQYEFD